MERVRIVRHCVLNMNKGFLCRRWGKGLRLLGLGAPHSIKHNIKMMRFNDDSTWPQFGHRLFRRVRRLRLAFLPRGLRPVFFE